MGLDMLDYIVIGGGPAGLTAALYCKRNGYNGLVFIDEPGGQMGHSSHIENYPGYESITGMDLAEQMMNPIEDLCEYSKIKSIIPWHDAQGFTVITDEDKMYETYSIILATGCTPRTLNLPDEEKGIGKYIHYCATCDGPLYKNKTVAVIGDANAAMETARTLLDQGAQRVIMFALFDHLFGEKEVVDRIINNDNIVIMYNSQVTNYITDENNQLTGLAFKNKDGATSQADSISGVFIAIGQNPNNELAQQLKLDLDGQGYIVAPRGSTSMSGVFAAGDIVSGNTRQIVSAAASGVEAAMQVNNFLINR